ncbi:uncharacterized protein LOC105355675 isoform X4 [Oryzias latipes]|uniref:uncharacterized protein LOC105355675 isoform X4 n=1 Tax=Oryzias latipes TaxID=8090 RepID=UPI000CE1E0FE|nr:uncharacterized protein LOC105355675 isoform X4 [Oryzias latipes]
MKQRINWRGCTENYVEERHLKLPELKEAAKGCHLFNSYIYKDNIPAYPQPKFQVSFLKHDTSSVGLKGIRKDEGFRNPYGGSMRKSMLWWSLHVRQDDVKDSEKQLMKETYPNMNGQIDLPRFATSPAFLSTSRLGNFRFSFPLDEVLKAYSQQFCAGGQPVMRVFETVLYKQEIMYSVLVHSPNGPEDFSRYPLLAEDQNAVCFFKDGRFIWRSEAMCETHRFKLIQNDNNLTVEEIPQKLAPYYVWDNVAIAFHVRQMVLKFDVNQLRQNLEYCKRDSVNYNRSENLRAEDAEAVIRNLWPEEEDVPRPSGDDEAALPQPPS